MIVVDPELDRDPAQDEWTKRSTDPTESDYHPALPSVQALTRFLREAQAAVPLRGQVSVLLTTDEEIRRLNRRFRGKNKPTDVLSFPAGGDFKGQIAGDLAISVPTARRQAAEHDHPIATEIKVLMLHGLLHLAGFDHEKDTGQMARRERRLRTELRLPNGLIERSLAKPGTSKIRVPARPDRGTRARKPTPVPASTATRRTTKTSKRPVRTSRGKDARV